MRLVAAFSAFAWGVSSVAAALPARALPCERDDALSETAADIVLSGEELDRARLLALARAHGFAGVALKAREGLDQAAHVAWLRALAETADGPLACGEAMGEGRRLVLVSVRGATLWHEGGRLRGRLSAGFHSPVLVIEDDAGRAVRRKVTASALEAGVRLEKAGLRRVQLVAEGPLGPRPVAELPLLERPSSGVELAPSSPLSRTERTRPGLALLAEIDGLRRRAGALVLRPNELLATSAQRHARRVCETGQVAHRIQGGDDPVARLRAEHVEARSVGEAVARGASADGALRAIIDSPSHRLTVTERRFTDAGIGQATDEKGHTCVVVLLAAWPRRIP